MIERRRQREEKGTFIRSFIVFSLEKKTKQYMCLSIELRMLLREIHSSVCSDLHTVSEKIVFLSLSTKKKRRRRRRRRKKKEIANERKLFFTYIDR